MTPGDEECLNICEKAFECVLDHVHKTLRRKRLKKHEERLLMFGIVAGISCLLSEQANDENEKAFPS